jgi:hypothetical protein
MILTETASFEKGPMRCDGLGVFHSRWIFLLRLCINSETFGPTGYRCASRFGLRPPHLQSKLNHRIMMVPTSIPFMLLLFCLLSCITLVISGTATQYTLPKDEVLVCSDSMENVCVAPTSCNKNGKASFDSGKNFNVGQATQKDGMWTIVGGYSIDFPSLCNITCQGNCTCTDNSCTTIQVDNSLFSSDGSSTGTSSSSKLLQKKLGSVAAMVSLSIFLALLVSC